MKFLLINPWICDSAAFDFWLKPLGLLYIGSMLKHYGHETVFIDNLDRHDLDLIKIEPAEDKKYGTGRFYNIPVKKPDVIKFIPRNFKKYGLPEEIFEKKLREAGDVDAIFMTTTLTYWYFGYIETLKKIREIYPDKPIFVGGMYVNLFTSHAEKVFKDYNVTLTPGTDLVPLKKVFDILNLPFEDFDWFEELRPAYEMYQSQLPYLIITTSIGCPYKCTYCATPNMWSFRTKSIESIRKMLDEIIAMQKSKDIIFFDDAFLLRSDLKELLKMLAEYDLRYHLPNGIHAKMLTKEIAELLVKANFKTIKLGFESTNTKIQKETGGKVSNQDLINAVQNLKDAGLSLEDVGAYILMNLPHQDPEEVFYAVDFCFNLGIDFHVNEFTPIPSTADFMRMVDEGIFDPETDPLLLNNTYIPFWWKNGMDINKINELKNYAKKKKNERNLIYSNEVS